MATARNYENGHSNQLHWSEFCEEQAAIAASEFYSNFRRYLRENPSLNLRDTASTFLKRFTDCIQSDFYQCVERGQPLDGFRRVELTEGISQDRSSPASSSERGQGEQRQSTSLAKAFFRRFSFRKKGRSKESRDDEYDEEHKSKTKKANSVKKEGIVYRLVESAHSGFHKWEKCRLVLIKTPSTGYLLEFYSPPKSAKPKAGISCSMLNKCRETTALEMPDREHTFVLKASNTQDYVFEANSASDLRSWLGHIRQCMPEQFIESSRSPSDTRLADQHVDSHHNGVNYDERNNPPPEIPPRSPYRQSFPMSPISNNPPTPINPPDNGGVLQAIDLENIEYYLREFPWFHGTFSRMDAAHLVLQRGQGGHGFFLVRQSETRKGEFVLTFNFQGRAKHLRMTLNSEGQCRVQHLWFQSIFDMLEHFRTHAIPLESGGSSDVTLTDYIIYSPSNSVDGLAPSHGGSVRIRFDSLERLSMETAPTTPAYV